MFIVCLKKFSIAFVCFAERYKKGGKRPLDESVFGSECTAKKFVRKAVMKEKHTFKRTSRCNSHAQSRVCER